MPETCYCNILWLQRCLNTFLVHKFKKVLRLTILCIPRNETQRKCSICCKHWTVRLRDCTVHSGTCFSYVLIQYRSFRQCYLVQYAVYKSFALQKWFLTFFSIGTFFFFIKIVLKPGMLWDVFLLLNAHWLNFWVKYLEGVYWSQAVLRQNVLCFSLSLSLSYLSSWISESRSIQLLPSPTVRSLIQWAMLCFLLTLMTASPHTQRESYKCSRRMHK